MFLVRSLSLFFILLSLAFVLGQRESKCPNSCSGHGTCATTSLCSCDPGWGGTDCSGTDTLLVNGVAQRDHVETSEWVYYHIDATSGKLVIEVNQTTKDGDADTYVRLGDYPTNFIYDYRDISFAMNSLVAIPDASGTYYIGIYGFQGSEYNIRATVMTDCPSDCSGQGQCESTTGTCNCFEGYTGSDCSTRARRLE